MKILKAIGGVFVKIWRWIKNTAWVQPLLIVGTIFGVIFLIPTISNGIRNLIDSSNSADTFYRSFKKSMEGGVKSDADRLLLNYRDYKDSKADIPDKEKKFFLMFTASGNEDAKNLKEGFEILRNNWRGNYKPVDGLDFNFYTIYTDETTTETKKFNSAFSQFIEREIWFLDEASQAGKDSEYRTVLGSESDNYVKSLDSLADPDPENFKTPTLILVDWSNIVTPDKEGITEVVFDVKGSNGWEKAETLLDCWNHTGDFSINPAD